MATKKPSRDAEAGGRAYILPTVVRPATVGRPRVHPPFHFPKVRLKSLRLAGVQPGREKRTCPYNAGVRRIFPEIPNFYR